MRSNVMTLKLIWFSWAFKKCIADMHLTIYRWDINKREPNATEAPVTERKLQKTSVTLTDLPPLSPCQRRRGFWVVVNQGSFGSSLAVRGGNEFRVTPNDTLWLVALWSSPAAMCPPCYTQLSLSHEPLHTLQTSQLISH